MRSGKWIEFQEVGSTQDEAKRLLEEGEPVGVVFAHHQTAGRGRFDRTWASEPGSSLTMSLVFRDYPDRPQLWLTGMAVALACAAAAHTQVRWPNDLSLSGKKIGGVLTEVVTDSAGHRIAIAGVGINLSPLALPDDCRATATDLLTARGHAPTANALALAILDHLERLPEPAAWADLAPIWQVFDGTPGKRYRDGKGRILTAIGIGSNGELIASHEGETESVLAADALFGV